MSDRLPIPPPRTTRQLVYWTLETFRRTRRFLGEIVDQWFAAHSGEASAGVVAAGTANRRRPGTERDEPPPRGEVLEWAADIIRRRLTLAALLEPLLRRSRHTTPKPLWTLLELGAYQLVFRDDIAPHAAIFETVELTGWLGRPRWRGFVNGVLRELQRQLTDEVVDHPAPDAVPLSPSWLVSDEPAQPHPEAPPYPGRLVRRFRRIAVPRFADPERDFADYFMRAFSLPDWLIHRQQRWARQLVADPAQQRDLLLDVGFWFCGCPRLTLRVNRLRTTPAELRERLQQRIADSGAAASISASDHPWALWLHGRAHVTAWPEFAAGLFTIQDSSAMVAGDLLEPRPGERILDLCAAPGTKTTQLAEMMEDRGRVLATDLTADKLRYVEENARRLGLTCVETRQIRPDWSDLPGEAFDAVLVDAPCSNTGVLGKRPEARWRLSTADIAELARLQRRLLTTALQRVRPGGRVVYSTCSLEPEENEQVVKAALRKTTAYVEQVAVTRIPGRPADGAFAARILRLQ